MAFKLEKKHVIAGLIGVVTVLGALAYLQYKKLMDYTLGLKGVKVLKVSANKVVLDLFLNFTNKSTLAFDIIEQEYKVYLNNNFVTKMSNAKTNHIDPKTTSVIGVNVVFDPTSVFKVLGKSYADILLKPETVKVKIDMKLKVKLYGFTVSIPYVYEDTLKAMMQPTPTK